MFSLKFINTLFM